MNLASRLKRRRCQLGLTQKELAEKVGVSAPGVQKIEAGKTINPRGIHQLAKALNCEPNWLLFGTEISNVSIGPKIQGFYPVLDWIQAGDWTSINAINPSDAERYPCIVPCSSKTFALKVKGESMLPKFEENELIFVDPEVQPVAGKYVVAMLDDENEATFKQLIIDGNKKYLKAINPDWPVRFLEINGNCTIVGVVISSIKFL